MPDPEGKKATIEVAEKYERVTGRAVGVGKSVEILICSTIIRRAIALQPAFIDIWRLRVDRRDSVI